MWLSGRKSFPSGHSAHAFCFASLLTLSLLRHLALSVASRGETGWARFLRAAALAPGTLALFVAASRVHDNWHHPADVVAGSAIGGAVAAMAHRLVCHGEAVGSGGQSLV